MNYIDKIALNTQLYTGVSADVETNTSRMIKISTEENTTILGRIYVGKGDELSNGRLITILGTGTAMSTLSGATQSGYNGTFYVDNTGSTITLTPIAVSSYSSTTPLPEIVAITATNVDIDGYISAITSIPGQWNTLFTIT